MMTQCKLYTLLMLVTLPVLLMVSVERLFLCPGGSKCDGVLMSLRDRDPLQDIPVPSEISVSTPAVRGTPFSVPGGDEQLVNQLTESDLTVLILNHEEKWGPAVNPEGSGFENYMSSEGSR